MFSFLKPKKSSNSEKVEYILKAFYFPPVLPGEKPIAYKTLNPSTKTKVLLFSYGVVDAFCQASRLSNEDSQVLFQEIDSFFTRTLGESLLSFMASNTYKVAFENSDLLNMIKMGGETYGDFASGDNKRGGQAIPRLSSLVFLESLKG